MSRRDAGAANCFLIGCLGGAALLVLAVVGAGFAMYYTFNRWVEEYTETEPIALAAVELTEEDYAVLEERVQNFGTALDEGTATEPFEITDEEINALLFYSEDLQPLGQSLRISFEEDTAYATLSMPLDDWGVEGRYLNGRGTFDVFMRNEELFVVPLSFEAAGKPLPDFVMESVRGQNMLDDAQGQVQTDGLTLAVRDLEEKLDGLEVQDGKLILYPKTASAEIETLPVLSEEGASDTDAASPGAEAEQGGEAVEEPVPN